VPMHKMPWEKLKQDKMKLTDKEAIKVAFIVKDLADAIRDTPGMDSPRLCEQFLRKYRDQLLDKFAQN
jgi:hypothetical protein